MMFGKIGKGNEDEEDLQNEQQKARQRAARDQLLLPKETNIIAATWLDDLQLQQSEMQERKMFFSNESILMEEDIKSHFEYKHVKKFFETG